MKLTWRSRRMDRRYSSSSSSTATETAKKAAIGNALNSSMRLRNGLSSTDSTVSPSHRKSFPSTSDVGSSFNSTIQVRAITLFLLLSTFRHRLELSIDRSLDLSEINNIFSYFLCLRFYFVSHSNSFPIWCPVGNSSATPTKMFHQIHETTWYGPHGDTSQMNFYFHVVSLHFAFFCFYFLNEIFASKKLKFHFKCRN